MPAPAPAPASSSALVASSGPEEERQGAISVAYDDALQACGGSDSCKLVLRTILLGLVFSCVMAFFRLGFYILLEPSEFECSGGASFPDAGGISQTSAAGSCRVEAACAEELATQSPVRPIYGPNEIRSWIPKLGLVCQGGKAAVLPAAVSGGYILGAIVVMSLADFLGRRGVVLVCLFAGSLSLLGLGFLGSGGGPHPDQYVFIVVLLCLFGISAAGTQAIALLWADETQFTR